MPLNHKNYYNDEKIIKIIIQQGEELVCVIGLHAVQFGNNWRKKNLRTAKLDDP